VHVEGDSRIGSVWLLERKPREAVERRAQREKRAVVALGQGATRKLDQGKLYRRKNGSEGTHRI